MEFKLNKIDPELRNKIKATTQEGKIHAKDNKLDVNKDKDHREEKRKFQLPKETGKEKRILVDAVKPKNIDVDAFVEKDSKDNISKGRFLDIRK